MRFKPDYVVHADDWICGIQAQTRKEVIETIAKWDGVLIEVPYTQGISSTKLRNWYEQESINYTKSNGDCYGW
jgi:phosphoenolpyruvate phosphomutase